MALPDSFLQELKARSDIVDVVSGYVDMKRRGRNMVGLCPFHGEKTASFNLYPENGSFYCFGCGAGGDVISFIRKIENLDYIEAVKFLAQRAGLSMPDTGQDEGYLRLRSRIYEANRDAARFYHKCLYGAEGEHALSYLRGRALKEKTIKHFGLGYAPATRFALVDYLKAKGYKRDEIVSANLAFEGRNGGLLDRFIDRVIFPIIDLRGNVIAFGGRIMSDQKPKYLNTSDTLVFKKSSNLFALNFAKNEGKKTLILCEGYMDVIALHQAGFINAVATLGTALTPEQATLMSRYATEVAVCYDSDEAGQKAANRSIPLLRAAGLSVRVLSITGGKDPDEFIKSFGEQGPARFQQLLDQSGNDVEYRLQKIRQACDLKSPDGRIHYLTEAVKVLATLESRIEQEVYAGRLSDEVEVQKGAILQQVDKELKKRRRTRSQQQFRQIQQATSAAKDTVNPEKREYLRAANAEEALIAYVINNPDMAQNIEKALPPGRFCTAFNRRVYETLLCRLHANRPVSLTDLSQDFSSEELSRIAKMLSMSDLGSETFETAQEYIKVLLFEYEKHQMESSALDNDAALEYMEKLKELKK